MGDFERVNAGSGVVMLHYETWVPIIGNKVNNLLNPLKRMAEVRTRVRFEKRDGRRQLYHRLPLMAAPRAPSPK